VAANKQAVRDYVDAVTTGGDAALAVLTEVLADGVTHHSPLGEGVGRDAVLNGLRTMRPLFEAGTWTDPVVDGDVVRVSATFPPGSVLGTAALTFRFDGDDKIAGIQHRLTPGAPPPATAVVLDDEIAAAINARSTMKHR
jgi:SnoaL-like domain